MEFEFDTLNFVRMWHQLLQQAMSGNTKSLARCISMIENEVPGYEKLLRQLPANNSAKVIGVTGPPGAGKSTLADALIGSFISDKKKDRGIVC